jgi:hypothetical protein
MKPHPINDIGNFIGGWYIDKSICDKLIKYFEQHPDKIEGKCGSKGLVKKEVKDSTDLILSPYSPSPLVQEYISELAKVIEEYKKIYPYCSQTQQPWGLVSNFNLQRYLPKQGYYKIHSERFGYGQGLNRFLVFVTYLNDVKEGGETEFMHQKLKIKAKKGLTAIFPVEWTHAHRGIPAPKETKYIVTGWYCYKVNEDFTKVMEHKELDAFTK